MLLRCWSNLLARWGGCLPLPLLKMAANRRKYLWSLLLSNGVRKQGSQEQERQSRCREEEVLLAGNGREREREWGALAHQTSIAPGMSE